MVSHSGNNNNLVSAVYGDQILVQSINSCRSDEFSKDIRDSSIREQQIVSSFNADGLIARADASGQLLRSATSENNVAVDIGDSAIGVDSVLNVVDHVRPNADCLELSLDVGSEGIEAACGEDDFSGQVLKLNAAVDVDDVGDAVDDDDVVFGLEVRLEAGEAAGDEESAVVRHCAVVPHPVGLVSCLHDGVLGTEVLSEADDAEV